ncbi:MAG: hypothetical protein NZL96_02020 [Patescibacteria group bacterium]|nr:hypothetical protein [Patescibacteria group bacterium]
MAVLSNANAKRKDIRTGIDTREVTLVDLVNVISDHIRTLTNLRISPNHLKKGLIMVTNNDFSWKKRLEDMSYREEITTYLHFYPEVIIYVLSQICSFDDKDAWISFQNEILNGKIETSTDLKKLLISVGNKGGVQLTGGLSLAFKSFESSFNLGYRSSSEYTGDYNENIGLLISLIGLGFINKIVRGILDKIDPQMGKLADEIIETGKLSIHAQIEVAKTRNKIYAELIKGIKGQSGKGESTELLRPLIDELVQQIRDNYLSGRVSAKNLPPKN